MALTVKNDPSAGVNAATYSVQAQIDEGDIDIVVASHYGTGVISGCAVTPNNPGVNLNVNVAAGTVIVQSAQVTVAAVTNLAIGAADLNSPRVDLIVVSSTGTVSVLAGTPAQAPDYAALTFDGNGNLNQVVLAAVTIPANAGSISASNIVDKRVWRKLATPSSRLFIRSNAR